MDIGIINNLKEQGSQHLGNVVDRADQINWANPSWDLFILVFFVGAVVLFMFSLSRERIFNAILSTYITLAIVRGFDSLAKIFLLVSNSWLWQIIIFLVVFIIITALISRLSVSSGSGLSNLWQIFYFSFCQTGLLITIIVSFFPREIVSHLFLLTRTIFLNNIAQIIWFLLPLFSLVFVRKR